MWFPNQLPFFIQSHRLSDVTFHCQESAKIYVDRVEQNVPILSESVECLAMPAEASGESASAMPAGEKSSSSGVKPFPAPPKVDRPVSVPEETSKDLVKADESDYEPSIKADSQGGKVGDVGAPDDLHTSEDESSQEVVKTLNHSLTHYPKSKHCEVCMRAKMTSRYHRKRGDPDPDETPPLHFGHMLRVDHLIMCSDLSKGSEGEQACLICFDEYSGCYQAIAQTSRAVDNSVACLRKFGGTKGHGRALCSVKSDSAQELVQAVNQLDWLSEPGLPNDPYHNAKLESNIRRINKGGDKSNPLSCRFQP